MEKFWESVTKAEGCWTWIGSTNNDGYGQLSLRGKTVLAHRTSWEIHKGEIPSDVCVCHTCDNPGCVNPEHLFLGSHAANMRDKAEKGRAPGWSVSQKGEDNYRARLTWEEVERIRTNVANGTPQIEEARRVGMSKGRISEIIHHKVW